MSEQEKINIIKEKLGSGSINIFGRPFAGKDYQGRKLSELFDGVLVGAGEIFRGANMPERVKQSMRDGTLVPTEDFINIMLPYFEQQHLEGKPLVLSSVGRWHGEEEGVLGALKKSNHDFKLAIYLEISEDTSYERYCKIEEIQDRVKRLDDDKEVLRTRFNEFDNKTIPVLNYYEEMGTLVKINGYGSREEITKTIIDCLFENLSK